MSRVYFFPTYDSRPLKSTYPSTGHGNLQTKFAAGGYRIPAAVISEVENEGNRNRIHQSTPSPALLGPVAVGVEPNKPPAAAGAARQQHTVTDASGPTSASLDEDGTFDSSSSAPYRMADEIKSYYVRRHSLARTQAKDESSQRTDRALRDIGRERELQMDIRNDLSRYRKAASGLRVAAAATMLFIVILVVLVREPRPSDLSSRGGAHEPVAPAKHNSSGASHNEFLMPVPGDDSASDQQRPEKTPGARGSKKQEGGNELGPDEILRYAVEDADAKAGGEEAAPVGENADPAARNPVEDIEVVSLSSMNASASIPTFDTARLSLGDKENATYRSDVEGVTAAVSRLVV